MRAWLLIFIVIASGGCAGYKLGPTNGMPAGSRSVKFQPFINRVQVPRVSEYLGNSLRKQLQNDGTFRLETSGSPDIMVSGEIVKLERSGLSYQQGDVLTPQEYTLTLRAHVVAVNVATGKTIIDRQVTGVSYIRIGNDQTEAERQIVPVLTDNIALKAIHLLVDGSW